MGFGKLELCLPSPILGRGAGGEGKDLILHSDAPMNNGFPVPFDEDQSVFADSETEVLC
jgi:hypothetical protein